MTAPPDMGPVGAELYEALAPLQYAEAETGDALARFLAAQGLLLDEVAEVVRGGPDGEDGWTAAADPARCPDWLLAWLAMWAGLPFVSSRTEAQTRALIADSPSQARGSRAAMEAAAKGTLTGGQQLYFVERDGGAYRLTLFTYEFETPDEDATRRAVYAAKPAGLVLDFEVRVGQLYLHVASRVDDYAEAAATWATYDEMLHAPPP